MITLKCVTDVVMTDGEVAFKAGSSYDFHMKPNGDIQRFTEFNNAIHIFTASGPDGWVNWFVYELELPE